MAESTGFRWQPADLRELVGNLLDERSSAWMYRELAARDGSKERAALLRSLAEYEERHTADWERLLGKLGRSVPRKARLAKHRILVGLARLFGVGAVLPLAHKEEVAAITKYKRQSERWRDPDAQEVLREVLPDEIVHEVDLFNAIRKVGTRGGSLRSAILGANDGLGSVLALVAGVAGATQSSPAVLVAGVAGVVAGAVSMAASNYVSVKAEQEIYGSQVQLQRDALTVAPEVKRAELQAIYRSKGLTEEEAKGLVSRLDRRPDQVLQALLAEEHGITEMSREDPGRLAFTTGAAFAAAGAIPVVPFLLLPALPAVAASVLLSGAALFGAGVLRSLVTLKPFLRNGLEMVLVGMGAAAATYLVGVALGTVVG